MTLLSLSLAFAAFIITRHLLQVRADKKESIKRQKYWDDMREVDKAVAKSKQKEREEYYAYMRKGLPEDYIGDIPKHWTEI